MSRIFPTQQKDELGPKTEFTGINWDTVAQGLTNKSTGKEAEVNAAAIHKVMTKTASDVSAENDNDEDDEFCEAKTATADESTEVEATTEGDGDTVKTASDASYKYKFTHPDQISSAALSKAKEEGNEVLCQEILAARNERRMILAQKIMNDAQLSAQRLAASEAAKEKVAETTQEPDAEKVAETPKPEKVAKTSSNFKKVSEMNSDEKAYLKKFAQDNDWPVEYVEAIMQDASAEVVEAKIKEIKSVMASELPDTAKKSAVTAMVKEAQLSTEDRNDIYNYWSKELGYDAEWAKSLIEDTKVTTTKQD